MKSKTNTLNRNFFLPIILLLLHFIVPLNKAHAAQDVFITQHPTPATQTITAGGTAATYTVAGSYKNLLNQTKSAGNYQWYSNTVNAVAGGTQISGANGSTYTPPSSTPGTRYYWCNIQQTNFGNANTNIAAVTIVAVQPTLGSFTIPNQNYGASYIISPPTSNSTGTFSYTSKNTAIASVIGTTLYSNSGGTTTIEAVQAANGIYAAKTVEATFSVVPIAPTLSFSLLNQLYSGTPIALTITPPTSNSTGAFTYSIEGSNSGVATISSNVLTITNGGVLSIKATQAATSNYLATTITTSLTIAVNAPANISYTTSNTFGIGTAITPLSPTATAPAVTTLGSGFSNPQGVAVDAAGNVYVADQLNNAVKKIAVNGTITNLGSGFNYPSGVAVDATGNVYVADSRNNLVKKIAVNGVITSLGSGFSYPAGVAVDASGNVYVADLGYQVVRKIAVNGTITTLGSGFSQPLGVAVDAAGNVYVADKGNNAVKKVAVNGTITILSSGFNYLSGVAVDAAGNVYVTDLLLNAVKKIATDGVITTIANDYSNGIAVDANGNVYYCPYSHDVKKIAAVGPVSSYTISPALPAGVSINSTTGVISGTPTEAITGTTNYTVTASNYGGSKTAVLSINFPNAPANISYTTPNTFSIGTAFSPLSPTAISAITSIGSGFSGPAGVAVDAAGNVYVADTNNNAVKKIAVNGIITTLGSGFSYPAGVAVDAAGNVYVADTYNNPVKKIAVNGTITTLGSGFLRPYGVAVDAAGNVYVADNGHDAVKKIAVNGTITTLGAGFVPFGIAVDAAGNVYVADLYNNAVKKIAVNGTITSLGSGFSSPQGVAVDAAGNVYVADYGNLAVKKIAVNGIITTLASLSGYPKGLAVNAIGTVYVSLSLPNSGEIQKIPAPGGAVSSYSITPALPAGVSFNTTTGVISGTPTAVTAAANYTVTASNGGGSKTAEVNIGVIAPNAPTASAQTFCTGATVANLVATGTDLKWYNVASGGTALVSTTVIVSGSYYVSQTVNGVESARTSVTLNTTPAPAAPAVQTF